ncbi:MAG: hypothetical protein WBX00_31555 [Isosphaeraceae bacterium]
MPDLTLDGGRVLTLRPVSKIQLSTGPGTDFRGASRERPLLIDVVAVDGNPIRRARLVVMDNHSVWLSHQAEVAPRTNNKPPAATGLSAAEAPLARELFLSLVSEGLSSPAPGPIQRWKLPWAWLGKHAGQVVVGVVVAVVAAAILAWLGLKN